MTITMNSSIIPSVLTSEPTLAKEALDEYVALGALNKVDNHKEHYAIQPCWMNDPANGVMDEIRRTVIGRWSKKLQAYVVAVKNIRNYDSSAGLNEDHRWLHVDIVATYYTFCPEEGQRLKGEIRKVGHRAAFCLMFEVFTATVYSDDGVERSSWKIGNELHFEINSLVHRRKGPIIRAKTLSHLASNQNFEWDSFTANGTVTDNSHNDSAEGDESRASRKEKRKKKKQFKIEQEENDEMDVSQDNDMVSDFNQTAEGEAETPSKKKKKKKKSSYDDGD